MELSRESKGRKNSAKTFVRLAVLLDGDQKGLVENG